ncbi:MAG: hypothetical protein ACK5XA_08615 [Tagaea sp.]
MPAPSRIYLVKNTVLNSEHLVRAQLPSQAVRHVVGDQFTAKVPTQDELVAALGRGLAVQEAKRD